MTKPILTVSLLSLALAGLVGCGDDASTSDSGTQFSCSDACEKVVAVGCAGDDQASCTTECEANYDRVPSTCSDVMQAAMTCQTEQPFVCGEDGHAVLDSSKASDLCISEMVAVMNCGACEAAPADDACDTCQKASCCEELKNFYSDPAFQAYMECGAACGEDAACGQGCIQKYPAFLENMGKMIACQGEKCSSECQQGAAN